MDKVKSENATLQGTNKVLKEEMESISKDLVNVKTDKEFIEEESSILKQEKEEISIELDSQKKLAEENDGKVKDLQRQNQEIQEQMKLLEMEKNNLNLKCEELTNEVTIIL